MAVIQQKKTSTEMPIQIELYLDYSLLIDNLSNAILSGCQSEIKLLISIYLLSYITVFLQFIQSI